MQALWTTRLGLILALFNHFAYADGQWNPSTLSEKTKQTATDATIDYHKCLNHEISSFSSPNTDSRDSSNLIMKKCESELFPIRTAFKAEQVPDSITDRYLRRKRNRAARQVLQFMMYSQSQQPPKNLQ